MADTSETTPPGDAESGPESSPTWSMLRLLRWACPVLLLSRLVRRLYLG